MKVELEWRPRAGNAALVLKKSGLSQDKLTVYVLDPAPADHDRRDNHRRLIESMIYGHTDAAQPACLCLLGSAGPPLLSVPGSAPVAQRLSLEVLLRNPPAFGRWWTPTRERIEELQREFSRFRLIIRLLLNHHQLLPIDWDGFSFLNTDADIVIVADADIPGTIGCKVISWPEFHASMMRSDVMPPTGYAPRITIHGSPDTALALAPDAQALGWRMDTENARKVLLHHDFRMPQGAASITLAILEGGACGPGPLPHAVFDRSADRENR